MSHQALFAPWRMDYIRSLHRSDEGACFLCEAATAETVEDRARRLVVWRSEFCVVLLNRFPYTNGHLLVAPRVHQADLEDLPADCKLDLIEQTDAAVRLLRRAVSAQGFNLGINLGRCAGAGVPGHLHQHVVPRWNGDVNFMSVVGDIQVVPDAVGRMHAQLVALRDELAQGRV